MKNVAPGFGLLVWKELAFWTGLAPSREPRARSANIRVINRRTRCLDRRPLGVMQMLETTRPEKPLDRSLHTRAAVRVLLLSSIGGASGARVQEILGCVVQENQRNC